MSVNPNDLIAETQPHYVVELMSAPSSNPRRQIVKKILAVGCSAIIMIIASLFCLTSAFLLAPPRTNVLLLGIDRTPKKSFLGRSDTNILVTILPLKPYLGMLSIPRDLWVTIPDIGENRINTAHYFAESEQLGSGPPAALATIQQNFGVDVKYFVRVRFDGFKDIVDALGGLDIELDSPMSGYSAGSHHLNGNKALAFVRDRQGTDDFFRMAHGQLLLKELWEQILLPKSWSRLPAVTKAIMESVDTNLPIWQWPRFGLVLLRVGSDGIDNNVISREMTNPFTTSEGAQVLLPDWQKIKPVVARMFGP